MKIKGALTILFLSFLTSCGDEPKKLNFGGTNLSDECTYINQRFDTCIISKVYSDKIDKNPSGSDVPVSRPPIYDVWKFGEAPEKFKAEWKTGDFGAETFGYINLGSTPVTKYIVSLMERSSRFAKMIDEKGKPVFKDSFNTSSGWKKSPDVVDGEVTGDLESRLMVLVFPFSESISRELKMSLSFSEKDGSVLAYLYNKEAVNLPIVGTVADPYGLQFKMEFYPYKNGVLSYSSTVVKLKKFQDKFGKDTVGGFVNSFFRWYVSELTSPLPI
jgi:hypothetical protein